MKTVREAVSQFVFEFLKQDGRISKRSFEVLLDAALTEMGIPCDHIKAETLFASTIVKSIMTQTKTAVVEDVERFCVHNLVDEDLRDKIAEQIKDTMDKYTETLL